MIDRGHLWQILRDRAEGDDAMRELLDALKQIEDPLADEQEFDASNLKLPYAADEDDEGLGWKSHSPALE
jgi:hypothetical protein